MLLNWGMLKHPINWFTVVLMVLIAGIAFKYFANYTFPNNPASGLLTKSS